MNQIPGHARAYTLWLAGVLACVALIATHRWTPVLGVALVILGAFLGDQATHLNRHYHTLPPTWIERQMQESRWIFVIIGFITSAVGVLLMVLRPRGG